MNIDALLSGNFWCVLGRNTDYIFNFFDNSVRIGTWQVDFVDYGHNFKTAVNSKISVGESLSLNALRCVNNKHCTLTSRQRTGNLVVKVNMTGSVNEVEKIFFAVVGIISNRYGTSLYCYATLTLKFHIVKEL